MAILMAVRQLLLWLFARQCPLFLFAVLFFSFFGDEVEQTSESFSTFLLAA